MNKHFLHRAPPQQQQGLALFVSMMLLLIITIMGMMSVRSTTFQESMVANARERLIGFEAAESAVFTAEEYLRTTYINGGTVGTSTYTSACNNGLCLAVDNTVMTAVENWLATATWAVAGTKNAALPATGAGSITGVNSAPRYIIELQPGNCVDANEAQYSVVSMDDATDQGRHGNVKAVIFRITARATGASADTVVMLQTNYGVLGISDADVNVCT